MSRGHILWRGVMVVIVAVAVAGCTRTISTTHYKVTIRVDGRDYMSDVVGRILFDVVGDRSRPSPYGRVLTFRLPDDRVVVLGTDSQRNRLECVPRLDQTDTGCPRRWVYTNMNHWPDGFIFNSATNPTGVEAFQFEPRDPHFAGKGFTTLETGHQVPITTQRFEMVSYAAAPSQWRGPRDTLDRDFPGYDLTRFENGKRIRFTGTALSAAAGRIGLPFPRDR